MTIARNRTLNKSEYKGKPCYAEDFEIKATPAGYYSVYRVYREHNNKTQCLQTHISSRLKAINYINWLIKYINTNYPAEV